MSDTLLSAFRISFASIAIIGVMFGVMWLLMWVMIKLPINNEKVTEGAAASVNDPTEISHQVATIAISLAFAEMEMDPSKLQPTKTPVLVSAWQLGMRTRQMLQKSGARKRN